ncbi:hypothetical protein GCM10023196_048120 [Actinoallomurus vinaceus]|uniref:Uncharacterized protein n=1 Tax=Actinoallomurus vinaceus TaxID=1080074 RepID=A0ABP8UCL2_9ACTN
MTLQVRTDIGTELHEFNAEPDHAHLSKRLWSPSYFAASCGRTPVAITIADITARRPAAPPSCRTATGAKTPIRKAAIPTGSFPVRS